MTRHHTPTSRDKQSAQAISGTKGYERTPSRFIAVSQSLDFKTICSDFLPFLPAKQAKVLDLGAGAGQNAAALSLMGFDVTAVEPFLPFLTAAKNAYGNLPIEWIEDHMPQLSTLPINARFDFILIDGVWHHLSPLEREQTLASLSKHIEIGSRCAISLRHGPAGMGTCVYPTDINETISLFRTFNLACIYQMANQPSMLPNKADVHWTRLVFEKR